MRRQVRLTDGVAGGPDVRLVESPLPSPPPDWPAACDPALLDRASETAANTTNALATMVTAKAHSAGRVGPACRGRCRCPAARPADSGRHPGSGAHSRSRRAAGVPTARLWWV